MGGGLFTPRCVVEGFYESKGSSFYAFLLPVAEFVLFLEQMKNEHTKAVHFVYALRELNEYQQIVENFSDDGEPKGTSGMPTLKVLRGYSLINVALLSIRYFGGTLLGTGGLVRAYSECAKDAIINAQKKGFLQPYVYAHTERLFIPFAKISLIDYHLSQHALKPTQKDFTATGAYYTLSATKETLELFRSLLS